MKNIFLFIFLVHSFYMVAQNRLDSLKQLTKSANLSDSLRAFYFNEIAYNYRHTSPDSTIFYASMALEMSGKPNGSRYQKAWAYDRKGIGYWMKGNFPEALRLAHEGLKIFQLLNDTAGIGQSYNSMANVYVMQEDYDKAIELYNACLAIYQPLKDEQGLSRAYVNLARSYYLTARYNESLSCIDSVLKLDRGHKGIIYAVALNTKGDVLQEQGLHEKAKETYIASLDIARQLESKRIITYSTRGLSEVYQYFGNLELSNSYAIETLELSEEIGYLENVRKASRILAENFRALKDFEKALAYYIKYATTKDSMFSSEGERELRVLKEDYEIQQKEQEIELLKAQNDLNMKIQSTQRTVLIFLVIVIGLIVVLVFILIRSNSIRLKSNRELAEKQKELSARNVLIEKHRQNLEEQSELLQKANTFKSKIFSIVSHDLKGPFQALMPVIDHIGSNKFSEEQLTFIREKLRSDVNAILDMINNLLIWSKNQIEGRSHEREIVNLKNLIEGNLAFFKAMAANKGISIMINLPSTVEIQCFSEQIECVIRNLIGNAVKYSQPGGEVTIGYYEEATHEIIWVRDAGVGIDDDVKEKLLNNEFSVSRAGTNHEKGSGLGLFICSELVQAHNGRLWFETKKGEGTTFYFSIEKALGMVLDD